MSAIRERRRRLLSLAGAVGCLALMAAPVAGWADTVHLKNGNTLEGDVVRSDGTQVTVVVKGQPQFFSTDEVDHVVYSQMRIVPPPSAPFRVSPTEGPMRVDSALLEAVGGRLRAFHQLANRMRHIVQSLQQGNSWTAIQTAQLTIREVLPVRQERFSPLYALADLLILLGVRAPTTWLALLLIREPRSAARIAEFLVLAYGLTMLPMAWTLGLANLWAKVFVFPIVAGVVACLFGWMFSLGPRKTAFAFLLTIGINLGVEYLLTSTQLL